MAEKLLGKWARAKRRVGVKHYLGDFPPPLPLGGLLQPVGQRLGRLELLRRVDQHLRRHGTHGANMHLRVCRDTSGSAGACRSACGGGKQSRDVGGDAPVAAASRPAPPAQAAPPSCSPRRPHCRRPAPSRPPVAFAPS
eukprot:3139667-Prymnesium_polylepis.1